MIVQGPHDGRHEDRVDVLAIPEEGYPRDLFVAAESSRRRKRRTYIRSAYVDEGNLKQNKTKQTPTKKGLAGIGREECHSSMCRRHARNECHAPPQHTAHQRQHNSVPQRSVSDERTGLLWMQRSVSEKTSWAGRDPGRQPNAPPNQNASTPFLLSKPSRCYVHV